MRVLQIEESCPEEIDAGRLSARTSSIENLPLHTYEEPFDLVVASQVGALGVRHPNLGDSRSDCIQGGYR